MICFVDCKVPNSEIKKLKSLDLSVIKIPKCNSLYDAISSHVDIQLNILDNSKIIIQKDIPNSFKDELKNLNISFLESEYSLGYKYPENIFLNALILKDYFIHNLRYTDPVLLSSQSHKKIIDIKQGYSKCSCLPISDKALITNDLGVYNSLTPYGFDILYLPHGDIILDGFDYGFIGGCGGLITDDSIAFFGNLDKYIHGDKIKVFLKKYNVKPIYLSDSKLYDRGSLFVL